MMAVVRKKNRYAAMHAARKEYGVDEEMYRDMLQKRYRVSSATKLTDGQIADLVAVISGNKKSLSGDPRLAHGKPKNWTKASSKSPMYGKIYALLCHNLDRGRDRWSWAYVRGTAQKLFGSDKVVIALEMMTDNQLWRLVAALQKHSNRLDKAAGLSCWRPSRKRSR